MRRLQVILACAALFSCARKERAQAPQFGPLHGAVAQVGAEALPASLVEEVAVRRGLSTRDALEALIGDALAASGARAAGLPADAQVAQQLHAARARLVILHARDAARGAGPPTDEEVTELTKSHWREVDLPPQMKVIHAVILRPKPADPTKDAQARALAANVLAATRSAADANDFEVKAKAVSHDGFDLHVETLEPFVADGRITTSPGSYDAAFAAASAALAPGGTSGVVESSSGWHVIRLIERLPGKQVALEERRRAFAEEIIAVRASKQMSALVSRLRHDGEIEIANGSDELLTLAFMAELSQGAAR